MKIFAQNQIVYFIYKFINIISYSGNKLINLYNIINTMLLYKFKETKPLNIEQGIKTYIAKHYGI